MPETLPRGELESAPARAWEKLPTPPSSGGAGRATVCAPGAAEPVTLEAERQDGADESHRSKRTCRRAAHILTPPSTRGRRMRDKLALDAEMRARDAPRHARHSSDSFADDWLWGASSPPASSPQNAHVDEPAMPYHFPAFARPVRDTPHNPFVEGGAADVGVTGPLGRRARARRPAKVPGQTAFVLYVQPTHASRGQRVVCAEPSRSRLSALDPSLSPPRPRLLFPPKQREGMTYPLPVRNALSDDEWPLPVRPALSTPGRRLFAQELAARAPPTTASRAPDAEAAWLLQDEDAKTSAPTFGRGALAPPLSVTNRQLLKKLETVDWADDGDTSDA